MSEDNGGHEAPTRRDYMKYGGTVVGGGLLAGCAGQSDSGSTPTETETDESSDTETSTPEDESYSVTMEPMGTVEFDETPETWLGDFGFAADIGVALGQFDGLVGMTSWVWYTGFYDELPDVSVDAEDMQTTITRDAAVDKELYYELDPDLITVDPNRLLWDLETEDINEIIENVAPFLGSAARRKRGADFYKWPDEEPYRYYGLHEQLDIYGQAFQQQERAAAMAEIHRTTIEDVKSRLPAREDRPSIGLIHPTSPDPQNGSFSVYNPISEVEKTFGKKQYRDLGVVDAFAGQYDGASRMEADYELLLEQDPDAIVFHFGVGNQEALPEIIESMQEDSLGSQLSAVQNDRLYMGGTAYQGPIINLFQTEMLAKQLYPEEFGEWNGLGETPEDEQLFDRQRVADIVNGDF
jgi:ABC-type Fe3+-hydroxamate transport system substrate-binding protein